MKTLKIAFWWGLHTSKTTDTQSVIITYVTHTRIQVMLSQAIANEEAYSKAAKYMAWHVLTFRLFPTINAFYSIFHILW